MEWDQVYREADSVWGDKPDHALAELTPHLPRGKVIDLGMGEGRNAIFFAVNGFDVKGIDISPAAVEKCRQMAQMLSVPLDAEAGDFFSVDIAPESCALIIAAMSLQFAKQSESAALLERILRGLMPGGWVYITTFSTEDPALARYSRDVQEVEPNTFFNPARNTHVHFFERDELLKPFDGLRLHLVSQSLQYDEGHSGTPDPHYHGMLTYIGQKPA